METPSDHELELGRNLAAASIATSHGIGLDDARKKYAAERIGDYNSWRLLEEWSSEKLPDEILVSYDTFCLHLRHITVGEERPHTPKSQTRNPFRGV
jgi:hypothetical protein